MSQARNSSINRNRLVIIDDDNMQVYVNLARSYEAEFSDLTHKIPNELGIFEPDTIPVFPYTGYLLYIDNIPIGFCVIGSINEVNDVTEFYIIPSMRKNKFGYNMAVTVFDLHKGAWQVRQIEGAASASEFWRNVIKRYTQNIFVEAVVSDPDWGIVTRQQFVSNAKKLTHENQAQQNERLPELSIFGNYDDRTGHVTSSATSSLKNPA